MADERIVGIIRVPLNAFTYQPGRGRGQDAAAVRRLSRLFGKDCRPDKWEHHIKGEINAATYNRVLLALGISEAELRSTIQTGKYPLVPLRRCILCLDGRQRTAAARRRFGKNFYWPVKLYRNPNVSIFSRQTKYPDGEICYHIFSFELGKTDKAESWRLELSEDKEKILNLLLRKENGKLKNKDIIESLWEVLQFPGMRRGFKLGIWHKYLALLCSENLVRYVRRIFDIFFWKITAGNPPLVPYFDDDSISCVQRRNPSNSADRRYIRRMVDTGQFLRGVKDASVRQRIKQNLFSLNVIVPSFETLHQNMIYFSIGAKILRKYIVDDEPDKLRRNGGDALFQSLRACWKPTAEPIVEVAEGVVQRLLSLNTELACYLLFLDGQRDFPHLSNDPLLQDRRGEPPPAAGKDDWYVFRRRARARQLGFRTTKISRGLAEAPPLPRPMEWNRDTQAKDWRGGKPSVGNFFDLRRDAFLPTLQQAGCRRDVTAAFVQKDFMEAFFGPCSYMTEGPEMPINWSAPGGLSMQVDDEEQVTRDAGPEEPMQVNETLLSAHGGQASSLPSQTQEVRHELSFPMQEITPPLPDGTQAPIPNPTPVDVQASVLAETLETPPPRGDRNSDRRPPRRRDSKPRSKSPSSRTPISRNRRERPKAGPPRSPILPPGPTGPTATEELARQSRAPEPVEVPESQNTSHEGPVQEPIPGPIADPTQDPARSQRAEARHRAEKSNPNERYRQFRRPNRESRSRFPVPRNPNSRSRRERPKFGPPRSIILSHSPTPSS
ncbi:hypothetical protein N656DRAFT_802634 [Canariomyces notabilis]|uniref:Uncharacterized protein n=1 Tax=Canariomyces notabilis TaxID=2074819 RepID=A0AAN6QHD3_9PEZI|nr:hypothetical protein N656DRAFT_802634 [Canariomyces arenarius]